ITEEGLQAVKKLLRKTATKNTAVSCHWIRSRSRSEFLWVVGSKSEFNEQGVVPVNYTNQINALKMDEINVNIENYYANTKKQPLDQHLFAVGYVAQLLATQLTKDEKLSKSIFVAGCWHDMGKIDPNFQGWLAKELKKKGVLELGIPESGQHDDKKSKNYPRHNEISLLLFHLLNKQQFPNTSAKKYTEHAIYWHHDKWFRGAEKNGRLISYSLDMVYNKLLQKEGLENVKEMFEIARALTLQINSIAESYADDESLLIDKANSNLDEEKLSEVEDAKLPEYKKYSEKLSVNAYQTNINENAKNNIARTAVISADRLVSSLSAEVLNTHIEEGTLKQLLEESLLNDRGLKADIKNCLERFENKYPNSDRNKKQTVAAQELSDEEIAIGVLNGPAGCGKTKIALEWAANTNAKKIIWICPRVQVCQGLVKDLTSNEYLPKTKIEICTGEFKTLYQNGKETPTPENGEFSGDIVLTTIDQVINTITTHSKVTGLVQYMNAHVVFDEYHEYVTMPAFNLLFSELVACKKLQGEKANALLVSATPNPYFVEELLGLNSNDIIGIDSFNQSQYKIEFTPFEEGSEENNPLYQAQPKNTIVISNTATTAQRSFIKNQATETAMLFHSKYKKSDKQGLFDKVFNTFKKEGTREVDILRAGPIVQASLNITCDKMITEFTVAENWLQRMGRLDRFGKNLQANSYVTAIPETLANSKQSGACARFLNQSNSLQSAKAWYVFLQDKLADKATLSIAQLYQIYQDFNEDKISRDAIEQDLVNALKKSVEMINAKVMDPVAFSNKNKAKADKPKIKKHSLRGDNRFVQMAVMNVDNGKEPFPDEYAYDENDDEGNLTMAVETICGYGDSEKNLLAFMAKKHHNIKEGAKKAYKDNVLLGEARSSESPIYLSYTPEDLKQVEAEANPYAIYYAVGKNQPIGAISVHQFNTQGKSLCKK
ncbi:MAG: CRISPR-associated endonuclease Cas3'', partial [Methyloprofundus sp.]|nr:CRISPR-associated endonuclease Cas3'' [Methyloprofundus sp.]